jgi:hypothetical protein
MFGFFFRFRVEKTAHSNELLKLLGVVFIFISFYFVYQNVDQRPEHLLFVSFLFLLFFVMMLVVVKHFLAEMADSGQGHHAVRAVRLGAGPLRLDAGVKHHFGQLGMAGASKGEKEQSCSKHVEPHSPSKTLKKEREKEKKKGIYKGEEPRTMSEVHWVFMMKRVQPCNLRQYVSTET